VKVKSGLFCSLFLLVIGLAVSPRAYAVDVEVEHQQTPSDACTQDPFQAYWSGFLCGNNVWNPVNCNECVTTSSETGCQDVESNGAGGCVHDNGKCYGWGNCTHTG